MTSSEVRPAASGPATLRPATLRDLDTRIYGGWLGKAIGVAHGAPVEGWTYEQIRAAYGDLVNDPGRWYLTPMERLFGADDDTSMPALLLQAVADGLRRALRDTNGVGPGLEPRSVQDVLSARALGEAWLNHIPEDHGVIWRGGYGVSTEHTALLHLRTGLDAPASGSAARNGPVVSQQIGGQIFSDVWGLLAPGDPHKAMAWADAAASISHDLDGRLGGQFIAALVSLAFLGGSIEEIVLEALSLLPADSHYATVMRDVHRVWRENPADWHQARAYIAAHYGYDRYPGICHIIPNAAVVTMALLYGGGDFDRTVRIATAAGWDTDCNAGNAGAVVGVLVGPHGIAAPWREPLRDLVVGSSVLGARNLWSIPALTRLTAALARALDDEAGHRESSARERSAAQPDAGSRPQPLGQQDARPQPLGQQDASPPPLGQQDSRPQLPGHPDAALQRAVFDLPGATEGVRLDDTPEPPGAPPGGFGRQAALAVEQTEEWSAGGAGSLKVVVQAMGLHRPARIVRDVLLREADLTGPSYQPSFSPLAYPGQTVRVQVALPTSAPDGVLVARGFADMLETSAAGSRWRRVFSDTAARLRAGRWEPVTWRLPKVTGMVMRLGLELRADRWGITYDGPVYVDELTWGGNARFRLAFTDWPEEFGAALGWTYSGGYWRVETGDGQPAYVGSAPSHALTLTGSPAWHDMVVEAEIRPRAGETHLVVVRAHTARHWYGAGLGSGGRLVLMRHDGPDCRVVAETPFPWRVGDCYRVSVMARGDALWAKAAPVVPAGSTADPRKPVPVARLHWRDDEPERWSSGCVGLAVRDGSSLACLRLQVRARDGVAG